MLNGAAPWVRPWMAETDRKTARCALFSVRDRLDGDQAVKILPVNSDLTFARRLALQAELAQKPHHSLLPWPIESQTRCHQTRIKSFIARWTPAFSRYRTPGTSIT